MDERGQAIEDLYRRRYGVFWNVLPGLTRDREGARDVVQEAFARAYATRRQLRDLAALEPWVWRIELRTAGERSGRTAGRLDEEFGRPWRPRSAIRTSTPP